MKPPVALEVTTVSDTHAVLHRHHEVIRLENLEPDSDHTHDGTVFRTLPTPAGKLLCTFATVNDVHFGETECGRIDDNPQGPIMRAEPGERPYPHVMNEGAVEEISAGDHSAVIVKGDLTEDGRPEEFEAFRATYGVFGERLHTVRGNHDSYRDQNEYAGDKWIELPGIAVALIDTSKPTETTGEITSVQFEWLDAQLGACTTPVIIMGHHQQWVEGPRSDDYFGLHPDCSDRLSDTCARHANVIAYTSGHTHRHRVRTMPRSRIPTVEIGCVKDFPGAWAEYRVHEGGVMQIVHRISTPGALSWSNRCRHLYSDFGVDYQSYAMGTLHERCFNIPLR